MKNPPLFEAKSLIGVVHLPALPGSPGHKLPVRELIDFAVADATALCEAGFEGIIVENFGDAPFYPDRVPAITVSAMTAACVAVAQVIQAHNPSTKLGINVLRNDAEAALSIATVCGADFIRVNVHSGAMITDQGIVQGQAHHTLRLRQSLGAQNIRIFTDVLVKHASPLGPLNVIDAAKDTWFRGHSDGLILSGSGTGQPTDPARLATVKGAVPHAPLFVGSGTTQDTLAELLESADGVIVGTALKSGGRLQNPIDVNRAAAMIALRDMLK